MIALDAATAARRAMLRSMLRIRLVEQTIAARYGEQEMRCPVHLSIGQEGVAVGVAAALERRDYLFSAHRAHAHYLAKGGDLRAFIAELYGRAAGCCEGRGGSMHLIDLTAGILGATPIVGSTLPLAVGAALGTVMRGEDRVTVVFFGDGASEEGVFSEALNFAALRKLPVIFVCENNRYSCYTPLETRQPLGRDNVTIAEGHGVPGARADGNEADLVRALTFDAVEKARRGGGPTYLEFATYRWLEHCGPADDDHLGYRPPVDVAAWKARDPIALLARALRAGGDLDDTAYAAFEREIIAEVDDAFAWARSVPWPRPERLYADQDPMVRG